MIPLASTAGPFTDLSLPDIVAAFTAVAGVLLAVLSYLTTRRQVRDAREKEAQAVRRLEEAEEARKEAEAKAQGNQIVVLWSNQAAEAGELSTGTWGAMVKVPPPQIHNAAITVTDRQGRWYSKRTWSALDVSFKWPADDVYAIAAGTQPPPPDQPDAWPHPSDHEVEMTFKAANGRFWAVDARGQRLELKPEVVVWAEGTRARALEQYIGPSFARDHGVRLVVVPFETIEDLQRELTAVLGVDPESSPKPMPDVLVAPHDWLGRVVQQERLHVPKFSLSQRRDFTDVSIKALTHRGTVWGVPYVMDSVALLINEDLVGDRTPATLDEAIAIGRELAAAPGSGVTHPLALQVGTGDIYHAWPVFSSMGGTFFGKPDSALTITQAQLDRRDQWWDGFVAGFDKLAELGERGQRVLLREIDRSTALPLFLSGRTPFLVCSSRALASLVHRDDLAIRATTVPPAGPHPARSLVSSYGFFIYQHAQNRIIAEHLVTQFLARPETGVELSLIQPRPPVQRHAVDQVVANYPPVDAWVQACRSGVLMPAHAHMRDVWDAFNAAETDVVAGTSSAVQAAQTLEAKIRAILKEAR